MGLGAKLLGIGGAFAGGAYLFSKVSGADAAGGLLGKVQNKIVRKLFKPSTAGKIIGVTNPNTGALNENPVTSLVKWAGFDKDRRTEAAGQIEGRRLVNVPKAFVASLVGDTDPKTLGVAIRHMPGPLGSAFSILKLVGF